MKPLERRKRLFARNRPRITLVTLDTKEYFLNWMWIAYTQSDLPQMEEIEFKQKASEFLSGFRLVFSLEDYHQGFADSLGPIGYVSANYDGFNFKPHVEWYPWCRGTNRLRCIVAFMTAIRSRRDVGMVWIETSDPGWLKLKKYIRIAKMGSIVKGRADGSDLHIYYVRGTHGISRKFIRQQNQHVEHKHDHPIRGDAVLPQPEHGERVNAHH